MHQAVSYVRGRFIHSCMVWEFMLEFWWAKHLTKLHGMLQLLYLNIYLKFTLPGTIEISKSAKNTVTEPKRVYVCSVWVTYHLRQDTSICMCMSAYPSVFICIHLCLSLCADLWPSSNLQVCVRRAMRSVRKKRGIDWADSWSPRIQLGSG